RTWRGGDFYFLERAEDVQRVLRAAEQDENPLAHPLCATAVLTGMRAGELAGLEWRDVNLDGRMSHGTKKLRAPDQDRIHSVHPNPRSARAHSAKLARA